MCECFGTCHPCPQKKFRGHHKHQALGYHMSRELPGDQGLGASWAPQGVWQGRAHPIVPVREKGRLAMGVRVRPEYQVSKPIVMRQVWDYITKSVHESGLGFQSTKCMARLRHGCNATQQGISVRATAEMQLPRKEGGEWGLTQASSSFHPHLFLHNSLNQD